MNLQIIFAIIRKQWKDTIKNKSILIQFLMFPIICIVLTSSVSSVEIPGIYFVILFATMYVGMAPIIIMASIMSEEKEQGSFLGRSIPCSFSHTLRQCLSSMPGCVGFISLRVSERK